MFSFISVSVTQKPCYEAVYHFLGTVCVCLILGTHRLYFVSLKEVYVPTIKQCLYSRRLIGSVQ